MAFSAGGDGGRRSPEFAAQFYTRFLVPIERVPSWCLILHSQYKLEGNALHTIRKTKEVVTYQMRFVSTAFVMMAMALMLLALTLLT